MITQQTLYNYNQALQLSRMVRELTIEDKHKTADIIRESDIARILHNRTINQQLKLEAPKHKGKIKRFLNALASHKFAEIGVDVLFQKWSEKL